MEGIFKLSYLFAAVHRNTIDLVKIDLISGNFAKFY